MDWEQIATHWGPAAILLAPLLKAHWDLVYKIVPEKFASMDQAIKEKEIHDEARHAEHMRAMRRMTLALQAHAEACSGKHARLTNAARAGRPKAK